MPSIVTHYYFGNDVLKRLPTNIKKKINKEKNIYDIFLQSFDNLFYYKFFTPFLGKKERNLGYNAQKENVKKYFQNILITVKNNQTNENISYLYGSICHYVLDSLCHPFVIYNTGLDTLNKKYNGLHEKMEVNIDAQVYKYKTGSNLKDATINNMLLPKIKFSNTLKKTINEVFYKTFNIKNMGNVYEKSIHTVNIILKYFVTDKLGIKKNIYKLRDFIFHKKKYQYLSFHVTQLDTNYLNLEHNQWVYPVDNQIIKTDSFEDLYIKAIKKSTYLITSIDKYLNNKIDLKETLEIIGNTSYVTGSDCNSKKEMQYFKF